MSLDLIKADRSLVVHGIAASSSNRVIGKGNALPWRMPSDLQYFKQTTMNSTLIMGRKTFDSIGKALPGRETIILSRSKSTEATSSLQFVQTPEEALLNCRPGKAVFICGGAEIYNLFWKHIDLLYITVVIAELDGDAYFPEINSDDWTLLYKTDVSCEKDQYPSARYTYAMKGSNGLLEL